MYEQHFGLEKRPFSAKSTGDDVFVGPQTANTIAGLKKALSAQDAVVAVSGPAGVGKTTLVAKALDALRDSHRTVRIGRMQLEGTDALELLLEELGTGKLPRGPIRQFTAFRELLEQLESSGKRLVIIVEDAIRTGIQTLAEIEALTAADAGDSGGAAVVIMGDESVADLLSDSQLARLSQRTRQRLTINPLSPAELRGYLMHCFRSAGGNFRNAFDDKSTEMLHSLSGGIPRVANYVAEAALSAAAADGVSPVPAETVARVARDEFGLEPVFEAPDSEPEPIPEPDLEPIHEPIPETESLSEAEPEPEPDPLPVLEAEPESSPAPVLERVDQIPLETAPLSEAEHEPESDSVPVLEAEPEPAAEEESGPVDADPIIVFSDTTDDAPLQDETEIPELIQDTLPDLQVLAPEVIAQEPTEPELPVLNVEPAPEPEVRAEPLLESEPDSETEPELESEPEPEPAIEPPIGTLPGAAPELTLELAEDDVPEWDRDPTLAELRPDLDALEKAMALAHGESADEVQAEAANVEDDEPEPESESESELELELEELPEITLDSSIEESFENTLIDEPDGVSPDEPDAGEISKPLAPAAAPEPRDRGQADGEIEKIAAELARAKTIEDVGDTLAETLFGDEINMIASQVIAAGPAESANDAGLFDTQRAQLAQAAGSPASAGSGDSANAARPVLQDAVEVSIESPGSVDSGLDLAASQRLKTVRALNADLHPSLREPGNGPDPGPDVPARDFPEPEPIEDQIDTSINRTLEALKVTSPASDATENDEADEKKKGGFFSRFKRS